MYFFLILGGVIAATIVTQLVNSSRRKREREATVAALGFHEVPFSEQFPPGSTAGCDLLDFVAHPGKFTPVAVGRSKLGEAAIFDCTDRDGRRTETVIGFRVPRAVPDFTLRQHGGAAQRAQLVIGAGLKLELPAAPKAEVALEGLRSPWVLRSTDPDAIRGVVGPAAEALSAMPDSHLAVEKGGEWIFCFRDNVQVEPAGYRLLLEEAARVVGLLRF